MNAGQSCVAPDDVLGNDAAFARVAGLLETDVFGDGRTMLVAGGAGGH